MSARNEIQAALPVSRMRRRELNAFHIRFAAPLMRLRHTPGVERLRADAYALREQVIAWGLSLPAPAAGACFPSGPVRLPRTRPNRASIRPYLILRRDEVLAPFQFAATAFTERGRDDLTTIRRSRSVEAPEPDEGSVEALRCIAAGDRYAGGRQPSLEAWNAFRRGDIGRGVWMPTMRRTPRASYVA